MSRILVVELGFGAIAAHGLRAEPRRAHEPCDAAPTHAPPRVAQDAVNAWAAVPLLVGREARGDLAREDPVLLRVGALTAPAPGVEPGRTHAVAAAERTHADVRALRRDEREGVALRAEQNRMAFFKRSCSSLSRA